MSEFKETKISSLGGMARIVKADRYFDCPPWIHNNKWEIYREKLLEMTKKTKKKNVKQINWSFFNNEI